MEYTECDEIAANMPLPPIATAGAARAIVESQIKPEDREGAQWMDNIVESLQQRARAETQRSWNMAITCCADSVAKLRASDVYRALGIAYDQGPYETSEEAQIAYTKGFIAWLRAERPDLESHIAEAVAFIEEDEKVKLT